MIRVVVFWVASALGTSACEEDGVRLISEDNDAPEAFVVLDEVPLSQPFSLQIAICGRDVPSGIRVDAMMPAHQHGMNYMPTVSEMGDGVFEAQGMVFHMPGIWEMQVDIEFAARSFSYTHSVPLQ